MTRFLIRLSGEIAIVCICVVAIVLGIGRILPAEDEISYSANPHYSDFALYNMSIVRHITLPITHSLEGSFSAWSPDGQYILLSRRNDKITSTYVMSVYGGTLRPLINSLMSELSPVWSPDGRYIAYIRMPLEGQSEIMLDDLQTGRIRQLTHNQKIEINLSWSPDSQRLVFNSDLIEVGNQDIFEINIESGAIHPLITTSKNELAPVWSPDGHYLLYVGVDKDDRMYVWDVIHNTTVSFDDTYGLANWSSNSQFIIYSAFPNTGGMGIFRRDIPACFKPSVDCLPELLTFADSGLLITPQWRPHQP